MSRTCRFVSVCLAAAVCLPLPVMAQSANEPVANVPDPGVISTGQQITPVGVQTVFDGRAYGVAFGGSEDQICVLTAAGIYEFSWHDNRLLQYIFSASGRKRRNTEHPI
jgi:hypothetical protein